jgi:hypothetical protein
LNNETAGNGLKVPENYKKTRFLSKRLPLFVVPGIFPGRFRQFRCQEQLMAAAPVVADGLSDSSADPSHSLGMTGVA